MATMESNDKKLQFDLLLEENRPQEIQDFLNSVNPADIAEIFEDHTAEETSKLIELASDERQVDLVEHLDLNDQVELITGLDPQKSASLIERMASDDRVDLILSLPEILRNEILSHISDDERHDIRKLMSFAEGTAGAVMTTDFASVSSDATVQEAIDHLRLISRDAETIFYVYVVDSRNVLQGIISLRYLIFSNPTQLVRDMMYGVDLCTVHHSMDREEMAELFSKYDLLAIPVVDTEKRMLGIVTVDDVLDILEEEATEDFYNLGAAGQPTDEDYLSASILTMAKRRLTWLISLVVVGFISGYIMEQFTGLLNAAVALTFFIPLLCGSGGNAGSQATTVIIRSLATGEIDHSDLWKVVFKEFRIGLIVGSLLGMMAAVRAVLLNHDPRLAITVALAMVTTVVIAKSLGAILPLVIDRIGMDPAIMSAPLIATILDVTTLIIYFKLATAIMITG
ncbi:MAG: magnesium transporter [Candidatus Wallbacteria bacterium HGW-Wallbacteria-1]|jgi:magnesium transporter|uniref:Magnesium transporter MgtE n=1 Tax=Candidatus Wallbacteria bacterium HGW-Wallbacteria-1 TaxID=2013854 RepID=A0A2N1PQG4_9BACT|nr:MAG: magnesium transporter [Candidatus Wallbacteria bacterium HGW-Wallbacteria-1]